jgi:hypothetical protein
MALHCVGYFPVSATAAWQWLEKYRRCVNCSGVLADTLLAGIFGPYRGALAKNLGASFFCKAMAKH